MGKTWGFTFGPRAHGDDPPKPPKCRCGIEQQWAIGVWKCPECDAPTCSICDHKLRVGGLEFTRAGRLWCEDCAYPVTASR